MASGPDLFVVCKSCGSEVSPYITECPYCGTRLRKRAPKLDRGGSPKPPKRSRPRLPPLRRGEIPGVPAPRRPHPTMVLIGGGLGMLLVVTVDELAVATGGNGAALALLAAWAMRDILGRRKGREDDADMLGVLAIAALLVLLPVATTDAHSLAGLGGGVAGIVMGLGLARLR